jgi:metal-responsive CopG/Arc/MetJ family transcriptional regulator
MEKQMGKTARITVILNDDLSAALDNARKHKGQSRSAFIRDAVALAIEQRHSQEEIDRYIQGYTTMPESAEEIVEEAAPGYAALANEPWS